VPIFYTALLVILIPMCVLIAAVIWLVVQSRRAPKAEQIAALQAEMEALREQVGQNLETVTRHVEIFGNVQEGIGRVTQATNQILELGQDIAALQDILRTPKLRGGLGEILLANLLEEVLPGERYRLQYTFNDGTRVDAVILLADRIVPIDAKFPMENFQRMLDAENERDRQSARRSFIRDVRQHLDETARYIKPDMGTFEFAMMYIPAENVYYEILRTESLFDCALKQHVIPVSPNSFFAYLNVIVFGLRGLEIEKKASLLMGQLSRLKTDFNGIKRAFGTLGGHIGRAQQKYTEVDAKLTQFDEKLADMAKGATLSDVNERPLLPGE
jgi:DNA recombination protein RmuC